MASPRKNPTHKEAWIFYAASAGLKTDNISISADPKTSSSKLDFNTFLRLKVLWRRYDMDSIFDKFVDQKAMQQFKGIFNDVENNIKTAAGRDPSPLIRDGKIQRGDFSLFETFIPFICGIPEGNDEKKDKESSENWKLGSTPPKKDTGFTTKETTPERDMDQITSQTQNMNINSPHTPESSSSMPSDGSPISTFDSPGVLVDINPPKVEYEATINTVLIVLLNFIRLRSGCITPGTWLPDPKQFVLRDNKLRTVIDARVDGYLRRLSDPDSRAYAIVEVKPWAREKKRLIIEMQESAQMAAWIYETPGTNGNGVFLDPNDHNLRRRLLISQDRHEIYITIAEYDEEYEKHVRGKLTPPPPPGGQGTPEDLRQAPGTPTAPRGGKQALQKFDVAPVSFSLSGKASSVPPSNKQQAGPSTLRGTQSAKGKTPSSTERASDQRAGEKRGPECGGFLVMNCFGPVHINDPKNMRKLCEVLSVLSMQTLGVV